MPKSLLFQNISSYWWQDTVTETFKAHYKFDDEELKKSQLKSEIELWTEK